MFPVLTSFRQALPVLRTGITAFVEDYQQPAAPERCAQSRRIPEWLFAVRFGHRQVIHILQHRRRKSHKDSVRPFEKPNRLFDTIPTFPSASQYILRGRRIYGSVQGVSAIPQWRLTRTWPFGPHLNQKPTVHPLPFGLLRRRPVSCQPVRDLLRRRASAIFVVLGELNSSTGSPTTARRD